MLKFYKLYLKIPMSKCGLPQVRVSPFPNIESAGILYTEREDSLKNLYIRSIIEDDMGNIWFGTNAGIGCKLLKQNEFQELQFL